METTCKLIAKNVLGSDTATVTFSSIPGTGYTDLMLLCSSRTDRGNNGDAIVLQFNADTGNNYSTRTLYGTGSSAVSATYTSQSGIYLVQAATGNNDTASTFGNSEAYIPNYAGSTNKSVSHTGVTENNATAAYMSADAGLWSSTAAITSLLVKPFNGTNFKSGSSFYLYGITKA